MAETHHEELIRRWQDDDDRDALDEILRTEIQALRQGLEGRGPGNPRAATCDDVAQDAVARLLAATPPPSFANAAALRGYLWKAARNLLIDRLRRADRGVVPMDREPGQALSQDPATAGSVDRVDREDLGDALAVAVNLLSPADQVILQAVYFRGTSIEEAANEIGISRDAANTRLVRARIRLARKLDSWQDLLE